MDHRLNLLSPEVRNDPYPHYARLRRESPICEIEPGGIWAVSRYDDVQLVLRNHQLFSTSGLVMATQPAWLERRNPVSSCMLLTDPPQHTRLRGLAHRAFVPSILTRLERSMRDTADRIVDRLLQRRQVDIVDDFSLPMSASVIGELLGLDEHLWSNFKRWGDHLNSLGAVRPDDVEAQARVHVTLEELEQYLRQVLERHRRQPGEGLVTELLQARVEGEALTEDELISFLSLLLIAGLDTTMHTLSHSILMLARQPHLLAHLRAHPEAMPSFVEELLRYEPPVHGTLRVTTAETELAGRQVPRGTIVMALLASALRDERCTPDPDRFDITRAQQSHLAFGHGVHFCMGAALGRQEARIALQSFVSRCDPRHEVDRGVEWTSSLTMRGLASLPMVVLPAGA